MRCMHAVPVAVGAAGASKPPALHTAKHETDTITHTTHSRTYMHTHTHTRAVGFGGARLQCGYIHIQIRISGIDIFF